MKHEWAITYYVEGDNTVYVGSGVGNTVDEAMEDFFTYHGKVVEEIIDVVFYK